MVQIIIDTPHAIANAPGEVNDANFMTLWPSDPRAIRTENLFSLYDCVCIHLQSSLPIFMAMVLKAQ